MFKLVVTIIALGTGTVTVEETTFDTLHECTAEIKHEKWFGYTDTEVFFIQEKCEENV